VRRGKRKACSRGLDVRMISCTIQPSICCTEQLIKRAPPRPLSTKQEPVDLEDEKGITR